jgi:hypothetical protein
MLRTKTGRQAEDQKAGLKIKTIVIHTKGQREQKKKTGQK